MPTTSHRFVKPNMHKDGEVNRWRKKPQHFGFIARNNKKKQPWYQCSFPEAVLRLTAAYALFHIICTGCIYYQTSDGGYAANKHTLMLAKSLRFCLNHSPLLLALLILILNKFFKKVGRNLQALNNWIEGLF